MPKLLFNPPPHEDVPTEHQYDLATIIGSVAALCTTVSYYPQLKKCWVTGRAGDLSLRMFATLATGVGLWIAYGALKSNPVIIAANAIRLLFLAGILYFKLRETANTKKAASRG